MLSVYSHSERHESHFRPLSSFVQTSLSSPQWWRVLGFNLHCESFSCAECDERLWLHLYLLTEEKHHLITLTLGALVMLVQRCLNTTRQENCVAKMSTFETIQWILQSLCCLAGTFDNCCSLSLSVECVRAGVNKWVNVDVLSLSVYRKLHLQVWVSHIQTTACNLDHGPPQSTFIFKTTYNSRNLFSGWRLMISVKNKICFCNFSLILLLHISINASGFLCPCCSTFYSFLPFCFYKAPT